jgi:hypothetical protein
MAAITRGSITTWFNTSKRQLVATITAECNVADSSLIFNDVGYWLIMLGIQLLISSTEIENTFRRKQNPGLHFLGTSV